MDSARGNVAAAGMLSTSGDPRLANTAFTRDDSEYLDMLRGASILRVMLGHLGLLWFFPPYSYYVGAFFPILFFVSGAVTYQSFLRSRGTGRMIARRLVGILAPFYLFGIGVYGLSAIHGRPMPADLSALFRWLVAWPDQGTTFLPIGQIWFISALAAMTLLSVPVFVAQKRYPLVTAGVIVALLAVAFGGTVLGLREAFIHWVAPDRRGLGLHLWAIMMLWSTYLAGSISFTGDQAKRRKIARYSLAGFAGLAAIAFGIEDSALDFQSQITVRSAYFLSVSFLILGAVVAFQDTVASIIKALPGLFPLLLFANRNSYGIFLLHTIVLYYVEWFFGWEDLGNRPGLALLRLGLVSLLTLAVAPAFMAGARQLLSFSYRVLRIG